MKVILKEKMENSGTRYEKINLNKLEIANKNPRYDNDWDINYSLTNYLIEGNKNYDSIIQNEIAKKLLSYEDDLEKFYELMLSIKEDGFDETTDNIFVIEKENGSFVVAEGNRRILALLMLKREIKFPSLENFKIIEGDDFEEEDSSYEKLSINFKKIKTLIENNEPNLKNNSIFVAIINDDKKLRKIVFSRHSSGKVKGKRDWSTGKYFWSLYKFKKENNKESILKISETYNKSTSQIKKDIKKALWIVNLIKKSELIPEPEISDFLLKYKVSPLEKGYVKKSLKLQNFSNETDMEKYKPLIEAGINLGNFEIFFESNEFKNFSNLVIDLFINHNNKNNKSITTRQTKHDELAIEKILIYFNIKQKIKKGNDETKLTAKTLLNMTKQNIQDTNWTTPERKEIITNFNDMKNEINKIKLEIGEESIIKKNIIYLVNILRDFLNQNDPNFLHSIASMIRTIDEVMIFLIIESNSNIHLEELPYTANNDKCEINFNLKIKPENINKEKWLFSPEYRKWRRCFGEIKNKLISWNQGETKFKIKTSNDNEIFYDISPTFDRKIINGIIHEPFNYFENTEFMGGQIIELMNEIEKRFIPIIMFILAAYEKKIEIKA